MVNGAELILALAAGLAAVWYGLYAAGLIWLLRRYLRFVADAGRLIGHAALTRSTSSICHGIRPTFSLVWATSLALCMAPLLLIVVPLLLGIAALALTSHVIHTQR